MVRELRGSTEEGKDEKELVSSCGEFKLGNKIIKAWDMDKKSLPDAKFEIKNGKAKLSKAGEPRYFLRKGINKYLLLRAFKKHCGVIHRMVRVLRDSPKFRADKALIQKLLKAGFKVA